MKSNMILKAAAFILAMLTLILTVLSGAGLTVCLGTGAYSSGGEVLTRRIKENIMKTYPHQIPDYVTAEDTDKIESILSEEGISAKLTAPSGKQTLIGENFSDKSPSNLTVKYVYLENYPFPAYDENILIPYFTDTDHTVKPVTGEHTVVSGNVETEQTWDVATDTAIPNVTETDVSGELTPPADTLPIVFSETDYEIPADPYSPDRKPLQGKYVLRSDGTYAQIFYSPKQVTEYYTGTYVYSYDGDYGFFGNVFPEEIEKNAYTVTMNLTGEISKDSPFYYDFLLLDFVEENMYIFIWTTPLLLLVAVLLCVFLASSSGHTKKGLRKSIIERIPFDLYLLICGILAALPIAHDVEFMLQAAEDIYVKLIIIASMALGYSALLLSMLMSIALRIKLKEIFKFTLIAMLLKLLTRAVKLVCRIIGYICRNIGAMWTSVIIAAGFMLWLFIVALLYSWRAEEGATFFTVLGMIIFPALFIYTGYLRNKIKKGCERIACGDVDFKIDTAYMTPNFRSQAQTINNIGSGLSSALTERVKSERLKTELITNVSHDLKTPLTSIVNYTDLLSKEQEKTEPDREKLSEYTEILCRQSVRLKKLTEDLVEASKASTGNVESRPERLDIGELLSQSAGEFADRFAEAGLMPIESKPQEPVYIFADGRHIWRIFENLLVNTCKYSLGGTRVYIDLKADRESAQITVKNISAQPLNISADELTERFVRGDASRHTEGSGLGLSIARSLAELQGGSLEISVDGDCFKAKITFKRI